MSWLCPLKVRFAGMEIVAILALLILMVGFLAGILVGIAATCLLWKPTTTPHQEPTIIPEEDDGEVPMDVDSGGLGEDPLTETEEAEEPKTSQIPQGSTERFPVYIEAEKKKMAERLAPKQEQQLIVVWKSGMASRNPHCVGSWQKRGEEREYRQPCFECGKPGSKDIKQIWICCYPSQVYHHERGFGKLKCSKRVTTIGVCSCEACRNYWKGAEVVRELSGVDLSCK